jgi:hypothetical protein
MQAAGTPPPRDRKRDTQQWSQTKGEKKLYTYASYAHIYIVKYLFTHESKKRFTHCVCVLLGWDTHMHIFTYRYIKKYACVCRSPNKN